MSLVTWWLASGQKDMAFRRMALALHETVRLINWTASSASGRWVIMQATKVIVQKRKHSSFCCLWGDIRTYG